MSAARYMIKYLASISPFLLSLPLLRSSFALHFRRLFHTEWLYIIIRLICKNQIIINWNGVPNFHEYQRRCNQKRTCQKRPRRCEFVNERDSQGVNSKGYGGTCGLDALVEACKVGEFASIVRQRTYKPVDAGLPGGYSEVSWSVN